MGGEQFEEKNSEKGEKENREGKAERAKGFMLQCQLGF